MNCRSLGNEFPEHEDFHLNFTEIFRMENYYLNSIFYPGRENRSNTYTRFPNECGRRYSYPAQTADWKSVRSNLSKPEKSDTRASQKTKFFYFSSEMICQSVTTGVCNQSGVHAGNVPVSEKIINMPEKWIRLLPWKARGIRSELHFAMGGYFTIDLV